MDSMDSPERPQILLHDPTLRDGHHAVGHQMDTDQLRAYATAANAAKVPVVEVGHGNGLGASSLQIGRARLDDATMLTTVRQALTSSRMGVFMAPGWGTSGDLAAAVRHGADVVRIAAHCTEADVTQRHLGVVRDLGAEAQGVLLMSHMAGPDELAEQCALMAKFGAQAVGIMDSAGQALIESPRAFNTLPSIMRAPRLGGVIFGSADYAASIRCSLSWDALHYARSALINAASAANVPAIDAPTWELNDPDTLRRDAERTKDMGFSGKGCVHPRHVQVINDARRDGRPCGTSALPGAGADRAGGGPGSETTGRALTRA